MKQRPGPLRLDIDGTTHQHSRSEEMQKQQPRHSNTRTRLSSVPESMKRQPQVVKTKVPENVGRYSKERMFAVPEFPFNKSLSQNNDVSDIQKSDSASTPFSMKLSSD